MFEIFDDLLISKYKKAVSCILIFLPAQLCTYRSFDTLHFLLIVLLLIDSNPTAPYPHSFPNPNLTSNGTELLVFRLDKGQLIQMAFKLNAFLIKIIVITDDASTDKYTFTSDWICGVQFHQICSDPSLQ